MRTSLLLLAASFTLAVQASWFGSSSSDDPIYSSWNVNELRAWLEVHNVPLPKHPQTQAQLQSLVAENWNTASAWTYDQYSSAQQSFSSLRDTVFDTWDESRLREFLLEHGVVAPKGPKEHLVLLAKQKYRAYNNAAISYASRASATASTNIYGNTAQQATKSVSSLASKATSSAAQASRGVVRTFDDSKDYVYSTWSDNDMRTWLEEHGAIKPKSQLRREELLQKMNNAWGKVSDPVWNAWSDSYIHEWLVSHGVIKSDYEKNRNALVKQMEKYYYSSTDTVYSSWSDSQLKQWLVDNGIMKSNAQASRDKMTKMVEDNYLSAKDTFWTAWSDNDIRGWLVEHGYLKSDAKVKRDKLVKLANEKWNDQTAKTAAYLTWPDARLRAYLRENGLDESYVPGDRSGLLHETRIRWVQTQTRAETLFARIKEVVNSGVFKSEEALLHLFNLLSGGWAETKEKVDDTKHSGEKNWAEVKKAAGDSYEKASDSAAKSAEGVKRKASEKYDEQRIKTEL